MLLEQRTCSNRAEIQNGWEIGSYYLELKLSNLNFSHYKVNNLFFICIELSEEFQASESNDNFSQEIQKPTKKKTTPKTKETKSSEKKVFLAVKSTAGSSKAPIKEPGTKGRGRPPKTAAGGSAAKTPKGAKETKKSIDIEEKKEVNIEQCSSNGKSTRTQGLYVRRHKLKHNYKIISLA